MVGFVAFCFVILSFSYVAYTVYKLRKREREMMLEMKEKNALQSSARQAALAAYSTAETGSAIGIASNATGVAGRSAAQAEQFRAVQTVHAALSNFLTSFAHVTAESARIAIPLNLYKNTAPAYPAPSAPAATQAPLNTNKLCPKCGANWDNSFSFCLHCSYTAA